MERYNSRKSQFKNPFGAVRAGRDITLNYHLESAIIAEEVTLCLRLADTDIINRFSFSLISNNDNYKEYSLTFQVKDEGLYFYRFEINTLQGIIFVGKGENNEAVHKDFLPEWQLTIFMRDFVTPDRYKGGTIYHIFVDRFCRDDSVKTARTLNLWDTKPTIKSVDGVYHADDFWGGNLEGIRSKLPYLKSLGVTLIYLSPLVKSVSNHRYDTGDYLELDETVGSEEDYKKLINSASELSIDIMLDGVFNHTGSDSRYFNKYNSYSSVGAYQSKESQYYKWYKFDLYPNDYHSWWGIENVPTVDKENESFRELILGDKGFVSKWLGLGANALRVDVSDELPDNFLDSLRTKLKAMNPNVLIIGEVWEDASNKISYGARRRYLTGAQLDGVMNYPYKEAIIGYAMGNLKEKFEDQIMTILENYPECVINVSMNLLGSHDTTRIINVFFEAEKHSLCDSRVTDDVYQLAKCRLKLASTLQYTLPGIPAIYYGDEVGLAGGKDPFNRATFPWGKEDLEILAHYKKLGSIRSQYASAFTGKIAFSDIEGLLTMTRIGTENITVFANNKQQEVQLPYKIFDLVSEKYMETIAPITAVITRDFSINSENI